MEQPMAAPLFSKICMYRYWAAGRDKLACWLVGGSVVGLAALVNGDFGERCAVYNSVQVLMTGIISGGLKSANVRLCIGENVTT